MGIQKFWLMPNSMDAERLEDDNKVWSTRRSNLGDGQPLLMTHCYPEEQARVFPVQSSRGKAASSTSAEGLPPQIIPSRPGRRKRRDRDARYN
jgi:hypothetical protein